MAKKKDKANDGELPEDSSAGDVTEQPTEPAVDVPAATPAARWRVTLAASTPVQFPSLVVEAESQDAAKAAFDAVNGILGSDHPYTIERV